MSLNPMFQTLNAIRDRLGADFTSVVESWVSQSYLQLHAQLYAIQCYCGKF